jgi:hypothetical protein
MSFLPNSTYSAPGTPLYASLADFQSLSTSVQAINISTATGAGVAVSEPTLNNFVFSNALSNAGGISFVTTPGSRVLGLSNAGVTSVAVGTGLSTSGATGAITLANTGVTSVSAGAGITLGGTSTAPSVTNSITSSINKVLNIWSSTPISIATPVGGGITTLVTYGSFVVGKTYLISFAGDVACGSTTISAGDKGMLMGIQPVGTGEQLVFCEGPVNYTGIGFATSFTYTAPQTSLNVYVQGDGTNTEVIIGTLSNVTIIQLD